jgi:HlyD family secretion protein
MPKQVKFYKKIKIYIIIAALLILIGGAYAYFNKTVAPSYDFVLAQKSNITQEVSVTGHVKAAENVDLAFEVGGKAEKIYVNVGDKVKAGDPLVSLNSDDLKAQLLQAQANVNSAVAREQQYESSVQSEQAKLDDLKNGYSREEIQLAETGVSNARKVIIDSETQLSDTKSKADADMQSVYHDALNSLTQAVYAGKTALMTIADIQYTHFNGSGTTYDNTISLAKETAVYDLFGEQNAGMWTTKVISGLQSGLYGEAQSAASSSDPVNTEDLITKISDALYVVKDALNSIPVIDALTATEKTSLDSQKANINAEISSLSAKQQNISVQKANNNNAISGAQTAINVAKNALETAENELKLKRAGYSADQISAQKSQVDSAKSNLASQKASVNQAAANVQYYVAQIDKTMLKSPIDGVVTSMEAKLGEIVLPSSSSSDIQKPLVSIISEGTFEIEAYVPEADIAKVKVGDDANVTLDAYGNDVDFQAVVMDIDPAETMIEGVATYKTTLQFAGTDDRIKSGMTANVDIMTDKRENVITIPQRAVISKDGEKIVQVLKYQPNPKDPSENIETLTEVVVKIGLKGSDGSIEITDGLNEGDKVVTFIKS